MCLQHQVTHGMVLLVVDISMHVDDDNWKFCFRLMNYQVANCKCGGMASYANCKDLSLQQVEMVSFDKLFGFGTWNLYILILSTRRGNYTDKKT
jgi:hypothetical protein